MRSRTAADLLNVVARLRDEREAHLEAIAAIDAAFDTLGLKLSAPVRKGRPKASEAAPRIAVRKRKRRKAAKPAAAGKAKGRKRKAAKQPAAPRRFAVPGPEAVVQMVKAAGVGGAKSSALAKAWQKQGRKGNVHVVIMELVRAGRLKREKLEGERGSLYRAG